MDKDIEVWLHDMLAAIDEIFSFLPEPRNYLAFEKDLKTRRAVERNIEIIGEAMSRILKLKPDFQIANARRIVDTRNRAFMATTQFQAASSGLLRSGSCQSCARKWRLG